MRPVFPLIPILAAVASAQDTTGVGSLAGTILGGGPARLCVMALERCADSDQQGAFRIPDLRAGVYEIEISAAGRLAIRRAGVEVRAGLESRIEVTLPRIETQRQEITVTESVFIEYSPSDITSQLKHSMDWLP